MSARSTFALLVALTYAPLCNADQPIEPGVDGTVAPGDDFFRFANGEWLANTRLPAERHRWTVGDEIKLRTARQLAQLIREPGDSDTARKVAAFRTAYLDEAAIKAKSLAPVKPLLASIDRLATKSDLSRWLGQHLAADVDPMGVGTFASQHVFGFAASYGIRGERTYRAFLIQGGLGLDRDNYLDTSAPKEQARAQYRDRIAAVLRAAGFDNSTKRADAVLALETAIARVHASADDSSQETNADNAWRRTDFPLLAPGIDWPAFFTAAGLTSQSEIVVWQPGAIHGTAALVRSEPLDAWKDYLRFHVLHRNADVLPPSFGAPTAPRIQAVVDAANRSLPDAMGRLYCERYFPAASKARAQAIVANIAVAFRKRVERASWMSAASKVKALAKLDAMYFGVGYPETWQNLSDLRLDPKDAFGNAQRIADWNYRNARAKLGTPVDRREWAIAPHRVAAILNFQLESYNFSAALLQAPKFDPEASDATNYGAIGAIFAHEMSHFVDTLGAEYDAGGVSRTWWSDEDNAKYAAAVQPLATQYALYRPLPDMAVDGKRTLTENAADLAGLVAAFDAYRDALGPVAQSASLKRLDREFFIGFARSWRSRLDDEALRTYLKADSHAPDGLRIATVRNHDAWYEAFDVKPGQRLYLAPEERVRIW